MLSEGQNPAADDGTDEPKRNKMIQGQAFRADACRQADPITVAVLLAHHFFQAAPDMLPGVDPRMEAYLISLPANPVMELIVLGPSQRFIKTAHILENLSPIGAVEHGFT